MPRNPRVKVVTGIYHKLIGIYGLKINIIPVNPGRK